MSKNQNGLKLAGYILLISNLYFGYGFALLIPQEMGIDNPYINGVLLGVADLIGFTIVLFFIDKFPRNWFHRVHVFIIIISSILLFIICLLFKRSSNNIKIFETIFSGWFF